MMVGELKELEKHGVSTLRFAVPGAREEVGQLSGVRFGDGSSDDVPHLGENHLLGARRPRQPHRGQGRGHGENQKRV